jgi:hypothetical protein
MHAILATVGTSRDVFPYMGLGRAAPAHNMPGGRSKRDAQRGSQSQRKHGVVGARIEDGPREETGTAAGPEDADGHQRPPTNRRS